MTHGQEQEGIIARLENWGAAMGGRMIDSAAEAGSIESRYRSPQHWHALGAPVNALPPDQEDAQVIESAVVLLPLFHHALLRLWYVRRLRPGTCMKWARQVGGERSPAGHHFPDHLQAAHRLAESALEIPAVIRRERARDFVRRMLAESRETQAAWVGLDVVADPG